MGNLLLASVFALAERFADSSVTLLFEEAENDRFTVFVRKAISMASSRTGRVPFYVVVSTGSRGLRSEFFYLGGSSAFGLHILGVQGGRGHSTLTPPADSTFRQLSSRKSPKLLALCKQPLLALVLRAFHAANLLLLGRAFSLLWWPITQLHLDR